MTVNLTEPLAWTTATGDAETLLENLQANIVKGHVRDHLTLLFLRFDDATEGRTFLRSVGALAKSAKRHLTEVQAFKAGTPLADVTSYVGVGLTASGYAAIGSATVPPDASFDQPGGMKASRSKLHDPPVSTWDVGYRGDVHAIVLVGDAGDAQARQVMTVQAVLDLVTDTITVVTQESGHPQVNADGHGIEHFGYVDGRSQPLFLAEDVADETEGGDGASVWDPAFPLGQLVVEDPGAHSPVPNDFDYDSDATGSKCPHLAHIRTTNPRGSGGGPGGTPTDVAFERSHLMARRGQTYGHRSDDPNGEVEPEDRPTEGVGLLFMAYNADLGTQFEFTQSAWANNPGFPFSAPEQPVGVDPVIGQGPRATPGHCPVTWGGGGGGNLVEAPQVPQAVTMKGGQYFFMPSLAFLAAL